MPARGAGQWKRAVTRATTDPIGLRHTFISGCVLAMPS